MSCICVRKECDNRHICKDSSSRKRLRCALFRERNQQILNLLQCVAVCCSVLQCDSVCCNVLQWVAVCCSVLQCVAW